MKQPAPLILTLAFDQTSFAFFDAQRQRYFPPDRNFIPAHLTLFHHLPGAQAGAIAADLQAVTRERSSFALSVKGLRPLGRGVAYELESSELAALRRDLAQRWDAWLVDQDRQKHQPHVTVQNKVDPKEARQLLLDLQAGFTPFTVQAEGLNLWHYLGGPWELAGRFDFTGNADGRLS